MTHAKSEKYAYFNGIIQHPGKYACLLSRSKMN